MSKYNPYFQGPGGRDIVLRNIKKRLKPGLILFSILSVLLIISGIAGIISDNWVLVVVCTVFLLPSLIPAIIYLIKYMKPESCKPLKKDPMLLDKAERLFGTFAFQNEAMIASPELAAFKANLTKVMDLKEILLIYKRIVHTNYTTQYFMVVETVRDSFQILYPKSTDAAMDTAVQTIAPYCQYARFGHSEDNLNYVEYMRTMWEEAEKVKQHKDLGRA